MFETNRDRPLSILEPSDGSVLVRTGGPISLPLRSSHRDRPVHWFVNGIHAAHPVATLDVGHHVIRCAAGDDVAEVTINIVPSEKGRRSAVDSHLRPRRARLSN